MILWLSAGLFLALGLFVCLFVYGYSFSGLLLCGVGTVLGAFALLGCLKHRFPKSCKWFRGILWGFLTLVLLLGISGGIWIGVKAGGEEEPRADYVIVLGAAVNGTSPSRSLSERLTAAKKYLLSYPESIAILSGGQGNNEDISEAQCMYDWLVAEGISPKRLRLEPQSTNTEENIRLSLAVIEEETGARPDEIAVVSSEYHLARAAVLGREEGVEVLGYPAETTDKVYFCNMYLREITALWRAALLGR